MWIDVVIGECGRGPLIVSKWNVGAGSEGVRKRRENTEEWSRPVTGSGEYCFIAGRMKNPFEVCKSWKVTLVRVVVIFYL